MGWSNSNDEEGVSAPSAADVSVEGTDDEMIETDRQLAEDRRRKLQERHVAESDAPHNLKRMMYGEQPNSASKVAQVVMEEVHRPGLARCQCVDWGVCARWTGAHAGAERIVCMRFSQDGNPFVSHVHG